MVARSQSSDADDRYGDSVVAVIEVKVRRNGSMSVAGCIDNLPYALAMLDNARDSIRNYHRRKKVADGGLVIPASDTGVVA